jgi:two-component system chemotaxis response regulator CheB
MENDKIKIMIVEDSRVTRDLIKHLLSINSSVEVIATAENGVEALEMLEKNRPDVILTDIVMPKMDGFELTKRIMQTHPIPIIVMSGVYSAEEMKRSFSLFDAGAIAIMEKPRGLVDEHFIDTAKFIFETVRVLSTIREFKEKSGISKPEDQKTPDHIKAIIQKKKSTDGQIDAVAIGSSVGGPKALRTLLSPLPATCSFPVFIVQHIAPGFVKGFADWLNEGISLRVKVPVHQEKALPGHVYIAPDNYNMEVGNGGIIYLSQAPSQSIYVPSIEKLFQTVAANYGKTALAILLLGGEKDGLKALQQIKSSGGLTLMESEGDIKESSQEEMHASVEEISKILKDLVVS